MASIDELDFVGLARTFVNATEKAGWFGWGMGTDEDSVDMVRDAIKRLPEDQRAEAFKKLDAEVRSMDSDGEGLREILIGEYSGSDETQILKNFGLPDDKVFSDGQDEVEAGLSSDINASEDVVPDYDRYGDEGSFHDPARRFKKEPKPGAEEPEDSEAIDPGAPPMTPEEAAQVREWASGVADNVSEGWGNFKEGAKDVWDALPRRQGPAPKESAIPPLPPMSDEDIIEQTLGNPAGKEHVYIDPQTGELKSNREVEVPDFIQEPPEMPNTDGMTPEAKTQAMAEYNAKLHQFNNAKASHAAAVAQNKKLEENAGRMNNAALNPNFKSDVIPQNQRDNLNRFDEFKITSRARQHNANERKRVKAAQEKMDKFNEMGSDNRYNGLRSWYQERNAQEANNANNPYRGRSFSDLDPEERLKLRDAWRNKLQQDAIERSEMRQAGAKRWDAADLEQAKAESQQKTMPVAHSDGTITHMPYDEYDKWAQSQGKRTIAEMRRDKDKMENTGAFPTVYNDKGVETAYDGSVHPQNPFENPFAQQEVLNSMQEKDPLAGLETPEEQARRKVAEKHGISVEEMDKRRASGGLPEHIRAWRDMETDEVPPEIMNQRFHGSQIRDAQNKVFELEDAVEMGKEIEANQAYGAGSGSSMPEIPQAPEEIPETAPLPAHDDWNRRGGAPREYSMDELGFEPIDMSPQGEPHEYSWMFDETDMDADMERIGSPLNIGADFEDVHFSDDVYEPGDYVPPLPGTDEYLEEEEDEYMRQIYGY